MAKVTVTEQAAGKICPYCRFPVKSGLTVESCDSCQTLHHEECWDEGGGCAVFGCPNAAGKAGAAAPAPATTPLSQLPPPPPPGATPLPAYATPSAQTWNAPTSFRTGVDIQGLPLEFWIVVGLIAAAGIYILQLGLRVLPDAIRLFNDYTAGFTFVILVLVVLICAMGAGLLWLAWALWRRSRVARGMTYVVVGSLLTMVLFGDNVSGGLVLAMLAGLAAAAVLAFAPAVQPLFTGADAPDSAQPSGVVVARVSLLLWLILLGVAAVLNFCLVDVSGKYVAFGLIETLIVIGGVIIYRRLALPDRQARVIASAGTAITFILLLLGWHSTGFALMLGFTVAIPICLWVPADVRRFFGDQPIVIARQPA